MLRKLFDNWLKEKLYLKNVTPATIRSGRQAFDKFSVYSPPHEELASVCLL
jgi:hypothetical protein